MKSGPTPNDDLGFLLDIEGLAARLGTSVSHIRRLVFERRVPYIKVGGLVRFRPADIKEWLDDATVEARP